LTAFSIRVLNDEQVSICKTLHKYRNDAVHYLPDYAFKNAAPTVIKLTTRLIDSLFSAFGRKGIFNIFIVPGEIWVREEKLNDPFVQEFVLPCCSMEGAVSQFDYEKNEYHEDGAIVGDLSEEDFIRTRIDYRDNPDNYFKKVVRVFVGLKLVWLTGLYDGKFPHRPIARRHHGRDRALGRGLTSLPEAARRGRRLGRVTLSDLMPPNEGGA